MEKKKNTNEALTKGIAASLATLILASGIAHHAKDIKNMVTNDENQIGMEDTILSRSEILNSDAQIKKYAKVLYKEYIDKDFEEKLEIEWTESLARSIVELGNGIYPTAFLSLEKSAQKSEMERLDKIIYELQRANLQTNGKNIINLSDYIISPIDKAIINNSIMIGKNLTDKEYGHSYNDKLMHNYQHIDTLEKNYNNPTEQLMDYEWETINSTDYLQTPIGTRLMITSIWDAINTELPIWTRSEREVSEVNRDEHGLYYRYFIDTEDFMPYYPRENELHECEYYLTYLDNYGCHEKVYTEAEMYALAGLTDYYKGTYKYEETGLEPDPDIHQFGLEVEVKNRHYEALETLANLDKGTQEEIEESNYLLEGSMLGLGLGAAGYAFVKTKKRK